MSARLLAAAVLLASRAAWACPSCARDTKGPLQAAAIAGMILAPFAIGCVVALALRAEARRAAREDP
jgi:hypothetical protein